MNSRRITRGLFVLIFLCLPAFAQDQNTTHFAKNGLVFDYPVGMKFEDRSNAVGQQLVLTHAGTGAQVMVWARYDMIDTAEQVAKARKEVFDFFVDAMAKEFDRQGAKVDRADKQIEVGGTQASGVRLRAILQSEAGNADVYSLLLGRRLVMVSFIGSDKELSAAASDWATIRASLRIEEVDRTTKPPG